MESVQRQWGQREVVDHLCFITSVPKIGDVFLVGHIGFGYQDHFGGHDIQYGPNETDNQVRLRQMNADRADLFPQKGNGIQSNVSRAAADVFQQGADDVEQDGRLPVIQIDLVRAKGCLDQLLATRRFERGQ